MARHYLEQMLTPDVLAVQQRAYGRAYAPGTGDSPPDELGPEEVNFINTRDSFYLASINTERWPYLQHRGGPAGFLKVLGPRTLGFADYRGNHQLLTAGNLAGNDRVALFLMDYPTRSRLKLLGHARTFTHDDDPTLAERLTDDPTASKVERYFHIDLVGYDWNCTQHITPRYTAPQIQQLVQPLQDRITELEAEIRALRPNS